MNHHDTQGSTRPERRRGHGHRWMMVACCIPMLAIAVAIAATGAGVGFLIIAVMCTLMMVAMMGGMSHSDDDQRHGRR